MAYNRAIPRTWRQTKPAQNFVQEIKPRGISTEYTTGARWIVYLDAKKVGHIHEELGGFRYHPRGPGQGELFPTFALCRASLED